jgi:pimeloyl-ACP methyl ester carboxylesterase
MKKLRKPILFALQIVALALLQVTTLNAEESLNGDWNGSIRIMGQELGITAHIEGEPGDLSVKLDIPQQNALGIPMQNVSYQHPNVHFEIPGPAVATFEGVVDGDSIHGDFLQSGLKGEFELNREAAMAVTDATTKATGMTEYKEEEVEFINGEFKFAGTLTLPKYGGPFPAVVMITGSGPQNRDEELMGFKPFRVIADHLTRQGIAVLRYDDRGVGGSTGSVHEATSTDFATDVVAAVRFLKDRPEIDGARIGAIGHSEGGIIAPIAAQSGELAFVVLLAGTSMTGEAILYDQADQIMAANGATEEQRKTQRETQEMMMHAIRTDEGWDEIEVILTEQVRASLVDMPAEQRDAIDNPDEFVATQVKTQISRSQSPWFRAFIDYDPVPALEMLQIPALAIFGELDLQVPPRSNSEGMEKAFKSSGHEQYRIVTLPNANHLFQKATTGSPTEYATLEKAFVPELLPLITAWIKEVI